jgi:hypothetical protein
MGANLEGRCSDISSGYHPPLTPPVEGGGFPKPSPLAGEGRVSNSQSSSRPYCDAYGSWGDFQRACSPHCSTEVFLPDLISRQISQRNAV